MRTNCFRLERLLKELIAVNAFDKRIISALWEGQQEKLGIIQRNIIRILSKIVPHLQHQLIVDFFKMLEVSWRFVIGISRERQILPRLYEGNPVKIFLVSLTVHSFFVLKLYPQDCNALCKNEKSKFTLCATNTLSFNSSKIW